MTTLMEQEFWPELLERLAEHSLSELASEYDVDASELDAALAATTGDRPVQQEAWWPEVVREHERGSLRQLARRFGTNPRRLRRGLARCAVRVGGSVIDDQGVADLEPFRERLGKEPDRTLATEAGVTVEAIKGERRRLGIDPYRMKPDVEEWGGRPPSKRDKPKQRRRWQDAPEPVIIRRTGQGKEPGSEPGEAPEPEVVARPAPPRAAPTGARLRGLTGLPAPAEEGAEDEPSASGERRRRRLVRPSAEQEEPGSPAAPGSLPRLPRLGAPSPVRVIPPPDAVPNTVQPELPQQPEEPPAERKRPVRRKAAPKPAPAPEPAPELPTPPTAEASEGKPSARGAFAWQVTVPGRADPLLVLADDHAAALDLARGHLGGGSVDGAKAVRLAEVLHEGEGE
jgi:hypothetical protein